MAVAVAVARAWPRHRPVGPLSAFLRMLPRARRIISSQLRSELSSVLSSRSDDLPQRCLRGIALSLSDASLEGRELLPVTARFFAERENLQGSPQVLPACRVQLLRWRATAASWRSSGMSCPSLCRGIRQILRASYCARLCGARESARVFDGIVRASGPNN